MSRETLTDGYVQLMADLYDPQLISRASMTFTLSSSSALNVAGGGAEDHPWQRRVRQLQRFSQAMGLMLRLLWRAPEKQLRQAYSRRLSRVIYSPSHLPFVLSASTVLCSPD